MPIFEKYGVRKAIIFGSIIDNRFVKDSDIDLLVMGLPAEKYWTFLHELKETMEVPIDLYTDKDEETFVQKILSRGEVIYEV